jgi:hypothetical protein
MGFKRSQVRILSARPIGKTGNRKAETGKLKPGTWKSKADRVRTQFDRQRDSAS